MKCDNCRYRKMCYRRFNPIGDKYSNTDNCEHYEAYEERPHGEWIDKGEYAECSICGGCSGTQFDGVEPIPLETNFCPNCGADMRKRSEEEAYLPFDLSEWKDEDNGCYQENVIDTDDFINEIGADLNGF